MELDTLIAKRRTVRSYSKEIPTTEEIKKIINAARLAPSALNLQNWEFIAIINDNIKKELAQSIEKKFEELANLEKSPEFLDQIENYKTYSTFFQNAPLIVIIVEKPRKSSLKDDIIRKNYDEKTVKEMLTDSSLLSIGGAIENMILTALDLGYNSCWMCAPIVAAIEMKKILNLSSEDKIVTLLPIGKALNSYQPQPPKKALDEIMKIIE